MAPLLTQMDGMRQDLEDLRNAEMEVDVGMASEFGDTISDAPSAAEPSAAELPSSISAARKRIKTVKVIRKSEAQGLNS